MRRRRRLCPWSSWKPPKLLGHSACIAVYSTVACDARHRFGEYVVEHTAHVSIVIVKNYSRRAGCPGAIALLARHLAKGRSLGFWSHIEAQIGTQLSALGSHCRIPGVC